MPQPEPTHNFMPAAHLERTARQSSSIKHDEQRPAHQSLSEIASDQRRVPADLTLPAEAISDRLIAEGFPEINRHWQDFKGLGLGLEQLTYEQLREDSAEHARSLGRYPALTVSGILAVNSAAIALAYLPALKLSMAGTPPLLVNGVAALAMVGTSLLSTLAIVQVHRKFLVPMQPLLAKLSAFCLSKVDFRSWLDQQPRAREVATGLDSLGLNSVWDNPEYDFVYPKESSERQIMLSESLFTHRVLRQVLGFKDEATRKYVPGIGINDFVEGKKSVTKIVAEYGEVISKCKFGELSKHECVVLLEQLKTNFLKSGDSVSATASLLQSAVDRLKRGALLESGELRVKVWDRDPWRDLTYQTEFFSSASLRGTKFYDSGTRGRLAPFNYLFNKSISALDFYNSTGRVVRARIALAVSNDSNGNPFALLYVDGVEGTNSVSPTRIHQAIEDYARDVGFHLLAYNKAVHNQVPRRVVAHVAASTTISSLKIKYMDNSDFQYLDSFGLPLEPMEYQKPKGTVVAYTKLLSNNVDWSPKAPAFIQSAWQHVRRDFLSYLVGGAVALPSFLLASTQPMMLVPFSSLLAVGLYAHLRVKYRSIEGGVLGRLFGRN